MEFDHERNDSIPASIPLERYESKSLVRSRSTTMPVTESSKLVIVEWEARDRDHPYNWSFRRKITLTVLSIFATFLVMMNSTSITVAVASIDAEFNLKDTPNFANSYWPVAVWALGPAFGLWVFMPHMENVGVRVPYLIIYAIFTLTVIMQAFSRSLVVFLILRFLAGACASVCANVTCSILCNIWADAKTRSKPMMAFVAFYLIGQSFGPVYGAALLQAQKDWRWILYSQAIMYTALFPILVAFLYESRPAVLLQAKAKDLRATGSCAFTPAEVLGSVESRAWLYRPVIMLFREKIVLFCAIWTGFAIGLVYLFTQSVGLVFPSAYGFTDSQTGYIQIAIVIGELIGWVICHGQEWFYFDSARRNKERCNEPIPEARLYFALPASIILVGGGMFVYAWTSVPGHPRPWIVPAVGLAMVGAGITIIVSGLTDYITDAYSKYSGSAVGAIAAVESLFAGILPFAAQPMYNTLGHAWASSTLGFIAIGLAIIPLLFLIYGREIRGKSSFTGGDAPSFGNNYVDDH